MPELMIGGVDASRYLISAHCEQSANGSKSPGTYDLVVANPGGMFFGAFAPKSLEQLDREAAGLVIAPKTKVSLRMISTKWGCEETAQNIVTIFVGEIQKAECDELYLKIEGSCTQGGMTSRVQPHTWAEQPLIKPIVEDVLTMFGYTGPRHIYPYNNDNPNKTYEITAQEDFDVVLYDLAWKAQSIYFFDENDEFWFIAASDVRGFSDLTGTLLRGSSAANMVGHCNHVDVFGGSYGPDPSQPGSEIFLHNKVYASADVRDDLATAWVYIQDNGIMRAPAVNVPNVTQEGAQKIANNLLQWYRQYKDIPTIRVVGKAPGLLSKVVYQPWNGSIPPVQCDGAEEASMDDVMGIVTKRVVDISADGGFVCTLDVATNFRDAGVPLAGDATNFYSDPKITHPGIVET